MDKREEAKNMFFDGYNCCQSVIGVFCDELGVDFDTVMKLASSFGGGMGRMKEVCGCVTAMFMAAGLKEGFINPETPLEKQAHYLKIQELAKQFSEINGSIICRELLGECSAKDGKVLKKKPCYEYVGDAVEILEKNFS